MPQENDKKPGNHKKPENDKQRLHDALTGALESLADNARTAMLRAYETATHEENIAENKYDTLGLEAAYLAQGQARRLAECEADLVACKNIAPKQFSSDDAISLGALVQLEDEDGGAHYVFLAPAAGGLKITLGELLITVVTPAAPLGKVLLNTRVGDAVTLPLAAKQKCYEIVAVR